MLDLTESMETYTELVNRLVDRNSQNLSGKTQTSSVSITSMELLSLSLTVQSMIERYKKTLERNELFRGAGIKLVVLNIADIKEVGETIIGRLESDMMDLIHGQKI